MSDRITRSMSILPKYRRLMNDEAWRKFSLGLLLGAISGGANGLALMIVLPMMVTLATGVPIWGLGFVGWTGLLVAVLVFTILLDFIGTRIGYLGALDFIYGLHSTVGDKVASLPLGWFRSDSSASLSRMVTQEMLSLSQAAAHFIYMLVSTLAGLVVVLIGGWVWDWHLGLLMTAAVPVMFLLLQISRRCVNRGKSMAEGPEEVVATRIVEYSCCQGVLRSAGLTDGYPELNTAIATSEKVGRTAMWWEALGQTIGGCANQLVVTAMILLVGMLAIDGQAHPVAALVMIGVSLRFSNMIEKNVANVIGVEERRQMMGHVYAVLDAPELPVVSVSKEITEVGTVSLSGVEFGYRSGTSTVSGIAFDVPANGMCALVGPSGSGKTTITKLIARFYDVNAGQVRVGGVDVRDLTTEDLMAQLSMVFQDVYLFDDTLEANIRLGRADASDEEVHWAADLAGVSEIVDRLPLGWGSRVGEGGRALSGGERQRVSIARALVKKAPIVLFDEATSALDAENEAHIVAAMEELRRTSTLIVIAHKLETIKAADQIIVLDDEGRIAEQGRHADLVNSEGPYRRFWECRVQAEGWTLGAGSSIPVSSEEEFV